LTSGGHASWELVELSDLDRRVRVTSTGVGTSEALAFAIALTRLAAEDPAVHKLTLEVQHLLKPRSVYRDPTLLQRVLAKMAEA